MQTRLILIRHGETEYNRKKRYSGSTDIAINSVGIRQSKAVVDKLKREHIDVIYSSNKLRAKQSAKIMFPGKRIILSSKLAEIDFGVFEGLTRDQMISLYPKVFASWIKHPYKARIPKAETLLQLCKRISAEINKIVRNSNGKNIAIVFHGAAISVFINYILHKRDFWKFLPSSASLSIVEYDKNRKKLVMFNNNLLS